MTEQPVAQRTAIFGEASKVNASNEIIVKLVNLTEKLPHTADEVEAAMKK